MTSGAIAREDVVTRRARLLTDALEPKNSVIGICTLVCVGHYGERGIGWAVMTILFAAVLPVLFVVHVAKREGGSWMRRYLTRQQLRMSAIPVIMAIVATGDITVAFLKAPQEIVALMTAMLSTLTAIYPITAWWKISGHTSVYSGAVAIAAIGFGPWWLLLMPVAAPLAWSRVRLREHTVTQTVAGTALGIVVAGSVFSSLR